MLVFLRLAVLALIPCEFLAPLELSDRGIRTDLEVADWSTHTRAALDTRANYLIRIIRQIIMIIMGSLIQILYIGY